MKKALLVLLLLTAIVFFIFLFGQEFSYVGAGKCKICHRTEKQGKQFPIWEESQHFQSFTALASEKAVEIAQTAVASNPQENAECLKCHGPLFEKSAEFKGDGVSCEACHGPGSAYKSLSIMKNKEEAVKNGLVLYGSEEAIRKQCLTCHENAHGKSFDFKASWEKIKHPVPEKE